jgi:ABC-2 type transport system ATP-binding protein
MNALEIRELKKVYEPTQKGAVQTEALKGVSLSVERGDFFALLGPNGAGKSTLINIVCGLVNKSSGSVLIEGLSIDDNAPKAKLHVGVVPQEFNFGIFEKVIDIVVNQAGYYGIPRGKALPSAEKYLKLLGLWEKKDVQARELSGGMKRRLMIARALVHEPKLLILDEPTTGVDIELRRGMWEFLETLNKSGVTIILTTHYLEEAEQLCRNVAIINKGVIVAEGEIKTLLANMDEETFVFDLDKNPDASLMNALSKANAKSEMPETLELTLTKTYPLNTALLELNTHGYKVKSLRNKTNRLEEFFISHTNNKS